MDHLFVPIIMLTVTLSGGGILLYLLGRGRKEQAMDREQAALMTAQQFINVKDIRDRFLYTRDGQIFMYLRVYSISTDLYSDSEKDTLIKTLTAELSDVQYPFMFMAVSRPIDISPIIHEMTSMLGEAEEKQKELLRQEILQMSGYALSGDIVERQFYLSIWEGQEEGSGMELSKRAALLCEKFNGCSIPCDILKEKEIVRLLNLFHNPSYTHLEDTEYTAVIPLLEGGGMA